jgi:UDP-glucose 4-epimerase
MKLLIIGGAGYIGGVTTHVAKEDGHEVHVLDNLSTGRDHNVPEGVRFIKADVNNRHVMQAAFQETAYDGVMHFAGRILVPESMEKPYDYFATNSFGALNAIDAAVKGGVKHYIFSSSAAVYGEPERVPISEDDAMRPVNPYGMSKLLTENLLRSYQTTHGLQWAALRYFNVVGAYGGVGTDYPFVSHIVPKMLVAMREQQPIKLFGDNYDTPDGSAVRDYVHVADVARAHLLALQKMANGETLNQPINLASQHGYSVKEVIVAFNDITGANLPVETEDRRAGDPPELYANNERAKQLLGWQPEYDLARMIQDHYDWYKAQKSPNQPVHHQ